MYTDEDLLVVPWRSIEDFREVRELIFSGNSSDIEQGLSRIHEWLTFSKGSTLPFVKATFMLLCAQLWEEKYENISDQYFETEFVADEYETSIRQFVKLIGPSICKTINPTLDDVLKEFNDNVAMISRLQFCRQYATIFISYLKEKFWISFEENLENFEPKFEKVTETVKELIHSYRSQRQTDLEESNSSIPTAAVSDVLDKLAEILSKKNCKKVAVNALAEPGVFLSAADEVYVRLNGWIPISTSDDPSIPDFRFADPNDLPIQLWIFWSPLLAMLARTEALSEFVYSLMASQNLQQSDFCKKQSTLWGLNLALAFIGSHDSRSDFLTSFKVPLALKADFSLEAFIVAAVKGACSFLEGPLSYLRSVIEEGHLLEPDSNIFLLLEVYLKRKSFSRETDHIIRMGNLESNTPEESLHRDMKIKEILDFEQSSDQNKDHTNIEAMPTSNWKIEEFDSETWKNIPLGTVIRKPPVIMQMEQPVPNRHDQLYSSPFLFGNYDAPNQHEFQNTQQLNFGWGGQYANYAQPGQQMHNGMEEDSREEYEDADEQSSSEEKERGSYSYDEDEESSSMEEDNHIHNDDDPEGRDQTVNDEESLQEECGSDESAEESDDEPGAVNDNPESNAEFSQQEEGEHHDFEKQQRTGKVLDCLTLSSDEDE